MASLFRMVRPTVMQKRDVQRLASIAHVMREDTASADELGDVSFPDTLHHLIIDLPDTEGKRATFVNVEAVIVAISDIDAQIPGVRTNNTLYSSFSSEKSSSIRLVSMVRRVITASVFSNPEIRLKAVLMILTASSSASCGARAPRIT